jgi:hypothetical protein
VVAVVGEVDGVVVDRDAVGAREDAFAPGGQEAAVAVVDEKGVLAAVEDVDAVLGVGRDAGDVAVGEAGR